jgi:hypothetical protein
MAEVAGELVAEQGDHRAGGVLGRHALTGAAAAFRKLPALREANAERYAAVYGVELDAARDCSRVHSSRKPAPHESRSHPHLRQRAPVQPWPGASTGSAVRAPTAISTLASQRRFPHSHTKVRTTESASPSAQGRA